MLPALRTLIEAAILAPSGDNLQPWKFQVNDERREIIISVDETRDTSPMNAGQRMSRIAVGAAIENMVQTAKHNGWTLDVQPAGKLALISAGEAPGEIPSYLRERVTNRRQYQGTALSAEMLAKLASEVRVEAPLHLVWVTERASIQALSKVIAKADMTMFGMQSVRQAFVENIAFGQPRGAVPTEKLSVESLELSSFEQLTLKLLPRLPDALLRMLGGLSAIGKHTEQLVQSASGMLLVMAKHSGPEVDTAVGRALQTAWLSLTHNGLDAQPMMSLAVLQNMADHGMFDRDTIVTLQAELAAVLSLPIDKPCYIAAALRFGLCDPPSGRVGRRPGAEILFN